MFPSIESIENTTRHPKHEMSEKFTFISSNGPHSLFAVTVIEEALDLHFKGKKWHFVVADSKYYTSKVIDRIFQEADTNDLAKYYVSW